jgi:hypothetical protein
LESNRGGPDSGNGFMGGRVHEDQRRGVTIYGYFNNHYAGFGPASVQPFRDMCIKNGLEFPTVAPPPVIERTVFD